MALMVTKKHAFSTRRQYKLTIRFYIQTTLACYNAALLLKASQDLCGLRDSQFTRLFLNNYGLDGVILGDNDKALLRKHTQK